MIFKIDHHNHILTIINNLKTEVFEKSFAYFGGGTLITLTNQEYRKSNDIDFICSVGLLGYKQLRTLIFEQGYQGLFSDLSLISLGRSTMDQYGIRLLITLNNFFIKMEIIAEARFCVGEPQYFSWSSIPCLNYNDCCTAKLLANADRYMDDSVQSRDLIDLAILRLQGKFSSVAIERAENAYEVIRPLKVAIERFQQRENYRSKCFFSLQIEEDNFPRIIDGIDLLADDLGLPPTKRNFKEQTNLFPFE
jgi:hypothetical protein